ncbi:MAG: Type II secretion system protein E [Chlamydiales bacterium]|nr:Type II secretion system protein E [Chlamydiales bacterium]MCH9619627.1 Type II secretion system protein E [Chlamydiales bacterium]MCH9623233.1 Type II secretion system protein E [Chlamydiales bacterium]
MSQELAGQFGMTYVTSLPSYRPSGAAAERIPYSFSKAHLLTPIDENEKSVTIAIADPLNLNAIDELRLMLDKEIITVVAPAEQIQIAINENYHQKEGAASKFLANLVDGNGEKKREEEMETYDLLETKEEAPIIQMLNLILTEAISQGASDIHFEPFENDLKVRYRIDGVLQPRHFPALEYQTQLLTRIKVLAKLDIAEHRLPQDGRIKLHMGGQEIDFRVSTAPVSHGERIVMRILDKRNVILGLDKLGMLPSMLDQFRKLIKLPEGIVLVTGPTGSGKTTTLHSALWEIYSEETNIMTIEDPVEYKLQGIAQIAVRPKIGLTFASGLRHILRQDPDIVMVGEIRDGETAEIAIQAALTGHLVMSTLHTNDAPSALPRLIDMGVEPYLLSSTIVGVLAQRLVRQICPHCRDHYTPSDEQLQSVGLNRSELNGNVLYQGRGCKECYNSGYKGRHGIYELMPVTSNLQSIIAQKADSHSIGKKAREEGYISLLEHGRHLLKAGITTIAEVLRVASREVL